MQEGLSRTGHALPPDIRAPALAANRWRGHNRSQTMGNKKKKVRRQHEPCLHNRGVFFQCVRGTAVCWISRCSCSRGGFYYGLGAVRRRIISVRTPLLLRAAPLFSTASEKTQKCGKNSRAVLFAAGELSAFRPVSFAQGDAHSEFFFQGLQSRAFRGVSPKRDCTSKRKINTRSHHNLAGRIFRLVGSSGILVPVGVKVRAKTQPNP